MDDGAAGGVDDVGAGRHGLTDNVANDVDDVGLVGDLGDLIDDLRAPSCICASVGPPASADLGLSLSPLSKNFMS